MAIVLMEENNYFIHQLKKKVFTTRVVVPEEIVNIFVHLVIIP